MLTEIQRQTRKGGGIPVRALKESWKEAPAAIEELEKEGEVLVTRTAKDGQLRMVFWNEIKPTEDSGGMPVEKGRLDFATLSTYASLNARASEFIDLWHSLKVPNDVDLLRQLASGTHRQQCLTLRLAHILRFYRGIASDGRRSCSTEGASWEEEEEG